jgi:hypothetical protein
MVGADVGAGAGPKILDKLEPEPTRKPKMDRLHNTEIQYMITLNHEQQWSIYGIFCQFLTVIYCTLLYESLFETALASSSMLPRRGKRVHETKHLLFITCAGFVHRYLIE